MDVFAAAIITLFSLITVAWHMERNTLRRFVGHAFILNLIVHGGVIYMFMGTSTLGLMQAELMAIFFTIATIIYRFCFGYAKLTRKGAKFRWITTTGKWG